MDDINCLQNAQMCLTCLKRPSPEAPDQKLMRCGGCKWATYCNSECQARDWKRHRDAECKPIKRGLAGDKTLHEVLLELEKMKLSANAVYLHKELGPPLKVAKTEIQLERFWPALALTLKAACLSRDWPISLALSHKTERVETRLDGFLTLHLGRRVKMPGTVEWWPTAATPAQRSRMFRRLSFEGFTLEKAFGLALGLLETVYKRDYSLKYYEKHIVDFGITSGSVKVVAEDVYAFKTASGKIYPGQNPQDHYWLYFSTEDGETILFDACLFAFRFHIAISSATYCPPKFKTLFGRPTDGMQGYLAGRDNVFAGNLRLHTENQSARQSIARAPNKDQLLADIAKGYVDESSLTQTANAVRQGRAQDGAPDQMTALAINVVFDNAQKVLDGILNSGMWKDFPSEANQQMMIMDESYEPGLTF